MPGTGVFDHQFVGSDHDHDAVLRHRIAKIVQKFVTTSETHAFSGTVNASSSQPGGGTENTRKARGKAKIRAIFQPPMSRRHPKSTGIWLATSTISRSCDRVTAISRSERSKMIQPATGAGTQFDGLQSVALLPGRPSRHRHDDGTVSLLLAGPSAPGEFQIHRQVGNNERRRKRREERQIDASDFRRPPTARKAERAQFLATRSTCPPLGSSCRNVPWPLVSDRATRRLRRLSDASVVNGRLCPRKRQIRSLS